MFVIGWIATRWMKEVDANKKDDHEKWEIVLRVVKENTEAFNKTTAALNALEGHILRRQ